MRKLSILLVIVAVFALAVVPSFAQDEESNTIADIVVASATADEAEFTVLLAAVQAADPLFLEALSNEDGLWTVFAPTDAAFVALLEALETDAETLLANTELLNEVLAYHVVPGVFFAEDVVSFDGALLGTVLEGSALAVSVTDDGAFVNDSTIVITDIPADNGVVHVIDAVLVPASDDMDDEDMDDEDMDEMMAELSIAETVIASASADEAEFTVLLEAVLALPGAADILTVNGPFTVFAPTDAAFVALLEALEVTAEDLLADTALLSDVLGYHIVPGTFYAEDVLAATAEGDISIVTISGGILTLSFDGENVFADDATVVAVDVEASNGVIHVIDSVLIPMDDME